MTSYLTQTTNPAYFGNLSVLFLHLHFSEHP
jgi:hypothetical protein